MNLSAHQPNFFPWLGYFVKVAISDIHVILDDVEFSKNNWINRNIIDTGKNSYLTIPVNKSDTNKPINQVRLGEEYKFSINKIIKTLDHQYKKSDSLTFIKNLLNESKDKNFIFLSELNLFYLNNIFKFFEISTSIFKKSELDLGNGLNASILLTELCKKYDCSNYISGIGSKSYIDESKFNSRKISVTYTEDLQLLFEEYNLNKNSIIQLICDEQFDIKSKFPTLVNDYKKNYLYKK
tara:strand:+ start:843 stop:1556 length:714 start_codon:yes stop_codon:yes gene_type:complete